MGVKDLWQLLSPVGRRVSIETLEGKTLAIDMSIWLTQFIKAMRDEEGKMLKNAHILGTLRRVLKLLHHRIRPVFVFDGATPALKLRVVQNRRKNHERQESNRRAAVHKLILAQLKKQLLNPSTIATTFITPQQVAQSSSSNFAAGFNAPSAVSSSSSAKAATSKEAEPQFEWTDGSDLPKPKSLLEDEENNESEEEEQIFDLPVDNQLDIDALSSLPAHIRKRIIEDARRRERMRSRATYIPVADNPALYSQTQLANFLSTSKLNRRFDEAQKRIGGSAQTGIKIASEGSKKYLYVSRSDVPNKHKEAEWLADTDGDDDDAEGGSKAEHGEEEDGESDVEFTDQDWMNTGTAASSSNNQHKRSLGQDTQKKQKRRRLVKKNDSEVVDITSEQEQEPKKDEDGYFSPQYNYPDSPTLPVADEAAVDALIEVTPILADIQQEVVDMTHDDDPLADIEWEADDDDDINPVVITDEAVIEDDDVERVHRDYYMADDDYDDDQDLAWMKEDVSHVNQGEAIDLINSPSASLLSAPPLLPPSATSTSTSNKKQQQPEALQRAVATASGMGDWAGRAVRRVMKEHFHTTAASSSAAVVVDDMLKTEEVMKAVDEAIVATDLTASDEDESQPHFTTTAAAAVQTSDTRPPLPSSSSSSSSSSQARAVTVTTAVPRTAPQDIEEEGCQEIDIEATKKSLHAAARDSERVTEEMIHDVIQLIQAFNLPYIIAPFEAEAQCAVLEELGLVDGVITEDSDAFLFGAQSVYKNIFNDRKFVEVYLAEDAKRELGIAREDFIALAFFLGSDYTEGINGIGIVNAMEIIQAFPMQTESGGPVQGLLRFKQWLDGYDFAKEILDELHSKKKLTAAKKAKRNEDEDSDGKAEEEAELLQELTDPEQRLVLFDNKHRTGRAKWTLPGSFPDVKVAKAYFHPETNRNDQPFVWQPPVRSKARAYCKEVLGWTDSQLDLQLDPVLQRYAERSTQTRIDSHYMTYHDNTRFAKIVSERLRSAVVQITGKKTNLALGMVKKSKTKQTVSSTSAAGSKEKKESKEKKKRNRKMQTSSEDDEDEEAEDDNADEM